MSSSIPNVSAPRYRADIDGLRAVAVLSVLAFHLNFSIAKGGFVGVDIFFVISGYLIGAIVFSEIANSRFSIVSFYERRIRRIFPALFAMMAVSSVIAACYLLPIELVDYGKSVLTATTSASNIYFWRHSGYFDAPTLKPMLHTWSLAVEEQFYIFFPIALWLIRRFLPNRLRTCVVVLFFLSLIASIFVVPCESTTAFYLPHTRAWELLLGTILALGMFPPIRSAIQRNVAALVGAGLMLYAILFYTSHTPFPGPSAILPCAGAALVIWAGESGLSLPAAVLSWRPVVFIGLISYSLYLWHWPIIAFWNMAAFDSFGYALAESTNHLLSPDRINKLTEIVLSLGLAILSWRFVEQPFRKGALKLSGRPLFVTAFATMSLFLALSATYILSQGMKWRFSPQLVQQAYLGGTTDFMRPGTCFITSAYRYVDYKANYCLPYDASKKNYLVLGDSHSAMLWSALATSLSDTNVMQASSDSCRPLIDASGQCRCVELMKFIYQTYLPSHPVQKIILVARWTEEDLPGLKETLAWINQRHIPVELFGPMPEYDMPFPRLLAFAVNRHEPSYVDRHRISDVADLDLKMQNLAANTWHVPYVSLYRTICNGTDCVAYADQFGKTPLMRDADHLSQHGALWVVRKLIEAGRLS